MSIAGNAKDRFTEKLRLREALTAVVMADVEHEIRDVLTWAPECFTDEDSEGIRDQVIAQTRFVTDALTTGNSRTRESAVVRVWCRGGGSTPHKPANGSNRAGLIRYGDRLQARMERATALLRLCSQHQESPSRAANRARRRYGGCRRNSGRRCGRHRLSTKSPLNAPKEFIMSQGASAYPSAFSLTGSSPKRAALAMSSSRHSATATCTVAFVA